MHVANIRLDKRLYSTLFCVKPVKVANALHTHGFPRLRKSCVLLIVRHLLPRTTYVCILFLLCFFVCCAVAACGIYGADVLSRWSASGLHDYCCFSRCWMPCCAMWCIP